MISRSFPFDLFSERRISGLTCFFYLRSQENIEKIHLKWFSHRGAINGWIGLGSDGYLWVMWGKEHLTVLIKFSSCFKGVDGWQELPPAFCFYSISKKVDLLLKMAEVDIEQIFPDLLTNQRQSGKWARIVSYLDHQKFWSNPIFVS